MAVKGLNSVSLSSSLIYSTIFAPSLMFSGLGK